MKKTLFKLLTLFLATNAFAIASGDKATFSNKYVIGGNPAAVNYNKNVSCLVNAVNLTGTNTTPSRNTTTPLTSIADCQATLDSATDTVDIAAFSLDRSLKNQNCEATINYKITIGSGNTVQLQARINSVTVSSVDLVTSDNGTATINFPCGDLSNAPSVRIAQTAGSSSQAINWANAYLGGARNIGSVAQAQFVGSVKYAGTTNCIWSNSNTTPYANFSADSDCPSGTTTGNVTASTKIPGLTIPNAAPGKYMVVASGQWYADTNPEVCFFRIGDGTTGSGFSGPAASQAAAPGSLNGYFDYSVAQSSLTFQMQAMRSSGSGNCQIYNGVTDGSFELSVYRFPTSSELAVTPNQQNYGTTDFGTNTFTATTSNPTKGTTTIDKFWGMRIGDSLFARVEYNQSGAGSAGSGDYLINIPATTGCTIDTNKATPYTTVEGLSGWQAKSNVGFGSVSDNSTSFAGGVVVYDSTKVRLLGMDATNYGAWSSGFYPFSSANSSYNIFFTVPCVGWTANQNAPLLVGSITSGNSGATRFEGAELNCDASSSVTNQSYSSFVSAIGNRSTTSCAVTLGSGTFSAAPYSCNFTTKAAPNSNGVTVTSATSVTIYGPSSDYDGYLTCLGPR